MRSAKRPSRRTRNVPNEDKDLPHEARFAISALRGKFKPSVNQLSTFFSGLITLLQQHSLRALELLLSSEGEKCLSHAFNLRDDFSFWDNSVVPVLSQLSSDELQLGCRKTLTTKAFQNILNVPFFLMRLKEFLADSNILDPALVLSIVDRVASVDKTVIEDSRFMSVVHALKPKLSGVMLEHLLHKFFQQTPPSDAQAPLSDTSYNTLVEHRFDRHSNDHENIVSIELLPPKDELLSKRDPYLPLSSDPIQTAEKLFDTNFRLLREDLVAPMREAVFALSSQNDKQKTPETERLIRRLRNLTFGPVQIASLEVDRYGGTGFIVRFPHPKPMKTSFSDEEEQQKIEKKKRDHYSAYWKDNKNYLRKGAVLMFLEESSGEFIRFGEVLNGNHPKHLVETNVEDGISQIVVKFDDKQFSEAFSDTVCQLEKVMMVQADFSFFAYKPVLKRLQEMEKTVFISDIFLACRGSLSDQFEREGSSLLSQHPQLKSAINTLKTMERSSGGIKSLLPHCEDARGSLTLDKQQREAVALAFSSPMSLIQGPPGTGKSLCGAVIGALLHRCTKLRVLCLCYTNHALDDFLEDLIGIGIPDSDILRIGAGSRVDSNSPLASTNIEAVKASSSIAIDKSVRRLIGKTAKSLESLEINIKELEKLARNMTKMSWRAFMDYLRNYEIDSISAFEAPVDMDGFIVVGNSSEKLWNLWITGNPPPSSSPASVRRHHLWALSRTARNEMGSQWKQDVLSRLQDKISLYDETISHFQNLHDERTMSIMRRKRIIGCTTTGASIYSHLLDSAEIDVLIMEEAGEILEAHSVAAIGRRVQQMILIGDHLQLRPKVQNHLLSNDASDGRYGLDVSLFERLISNGVPCVCLEEQHRMSEAVATFVTELTYPTLRSAPSVKTRRKLIGFPESVIFLDHSEVESSASLRKGSGSTTSRTNPHEIDWVVAITEYILWQPEYNKDDIVILVLYRDQLLRLREALRICLKTNVRLNERDVADLVKAGEKIEQSAENERTRRQEIRVSTVDNFQGEEGNIVIASLVRSNENGDIGFVAQPQRINVLLSRAREAMIFVGNSSTLMDSRKGGKMWKDIVEIFSRVGAVKRGITVTCPKHKTTQLIKHPEDFAQKAPNGGCDRACDAQLKCGHSCSLKCHRGSCTKKCEECRRLERLKKEKERIDCERKQRIALQKEEIKKKEHEIEKMVKESRLLQDTAKHKLMMERLKIEQELARKELELIEKTSNEKVEHEMKRLHLNYRRKVKEIDGRMAKGTRKENDGTDSMHVPLSECTTDQGDGIDITSTEMMGSSHVQETLFSDEAERCVSDSDSGCATFQQSTVEDEWQDLRLKVPADERKSMDELMRLVGLASVKKIALEIFRKQLADRQLHVSGLGACIIKPTLNFSFVGNPGTGKTTVARLFAGILAESGVRKSDRFEIASASELLRRGEDKFEARIRSMCGDEANKAPPLGSILRKNVKVEVQGFDKIWYAATVLDVDEDRNQYTVLYSSDGSEEEKVSRDRIRAGKELSTEGGVIFIDESYDLAPLRNSKGAAIVNMVMEAAETHRENLTFVLAGYQKDIEEQLFAFNDGMPSRFRQVVFDDFETSELERIWTGLCENSGYSCDPDVARIAALRVAQGRKVRGFGNARAVRTLFENSCTRRLQKDISGTLKITAEDVLGQRPSLKQPKVAEVMRELSKLVGVPRVKHMFKSLVELAKSNHDREMEGSHPVHVPLNRVFVGNPGTGKTTVARLYGMILKALGFLSNGEVVSKVASDLMGEHIGQAQQRTKAIVENARGKVLLIDEAYGLDDDLYGKQALNTIVERVSGAPGEDIAVVLVGYEQEIRLMIDRQNPGLKRRFNMESCKVIFDDFTDEELRSLIDLECRKAGITVSDHVHAHATKLLIKQRSKPNFGNAGNVVTLVKSAVGRWTSRAGAKHGKAFSIYDIDPSFQENSDPLALLDDLEDTPVRKDLLDLALQIQQRKKEERSTDGLVGNYVFLGGPGTGKTTIARKLAKILFDMGVLASDLVVETSSSDLIGSYIGHSRANVESKMKEARGGVCFIDEAYHLGVGQFGREALTQLLTMLTLPAYMEGKTIVVLAGYKREVHKMLESNPGLKSRFSSYLHFDDWSSQKCVSFVCKLAAKEDPMPFELDDMGRKVLQDGFEKILERPGWANARDAIQVYNQIVKERDIRMAKAPISTGVSDSSLILTEDVSKAISTMLQARPVLVSAANDHFFDTEAPVLVQEMQNDSVGQNCKEREILKEDEAASPNDLEQVAEGSDQSDENESQEIRNVFDDLDLYSRLLQKLGELESGFTRDDTDEHRKEFANEKERLEKGQGRVQKLVNSMKDVQKRAKREKNGEARKRLLWIARSKEKALKKELEKEKKRQAILSALMSIGICPAGYQWHRIGNGFRCGGGSHYASFEDIAEKTGFTTVEVENALKEE